MDPLAAVFVFGFSALTHMVLDPQVNRLLDLIRANWQRAGGMATTLLRYVSRSGFAILALVANIALLPVLTIVVGSTARSARSMTRSIAKVAR